MKKNIFNLVAIIGFLILGLASCNQLEDNGTNDNMLSGTLQYNIPVGRSLDWYETDLQIGTTPIKNMTSNINWEPSDPTTVECSPLGVLGLKAGSAIITGSLKTGLHKKIENTISVNVYDPAGTGIEFNYPTYNLVISEKNPNPSIILAAFLVDQHGWTMDLVTDSNWANEKTVCYKGTWNNDNPNCANLEKSGACGKVTAIKEGKVVISVNYGSFRKDCVVNITKE